MENHTKNIWSKPECLSLNINPVKRKTNRLIFAAGILLLLYGMIEIVDCFSVLLMVFHVIENPYPEFTFSPVQIIVDDRPGALFAIFLFFAGLRTMAAIGLLKNRLWGFGMALFITALTAMNLFFLLPLSAFDAVLNLLATILLFMGYFERQSIVNT